MDGSGKGPVGVVTSSLTSPTRTSGTDQPHGDDISRLSLQFINSIPAFNSEVRANKKQPSISMIIESRPDCPFSLISLISFQFGLKLSLCRIISSEQFHYRIITNQFSTRWNWNSIQMSAMTPAIRDDITLCSGDSCHMKCKLETGGWFEFSDGMGATQSSLIMASQDTSGFSDWYEPRLGRLCSASD